MAKKKENFTVISTGSWVPPDLDKQSLEKKSYKIFINDLQIKTLIGIHEHEKKKKQKINISIVLQAFDKNTSIEDKIENVVSYEFIVADIKKLLSKGHIGLLETLGEKIASICLKDLRIISARINIQKMEVFKEAKSVGIEIFRTKEIQKIKDKSGFKIKK